MTRLVINRATWGRKRMWHDDWKTPCCALGHAYSAGIKREDVSFRTPGASSDFAGKEMPK